MMELRNDQLRENDAWIVKRQKDKNQPYDPEAMGDRAKLSKMNEDSTKTYESFEIGFKSYFGKSSIHRMQLALTFDLTFGHYWGKVGIPVYIPVDGKLFFINDFIQIGTEMSLSKPNELAVISLMFINLKPYPGQSLARDQSTIINTFILLNCPIPRSFHFSIHSNFSGSGRNLTSIPVLNRSGIIFFSMISMGVGLQLKNCLNGHLFI